MMHQNYLMSQEIQSQAKSIVKARQTSKNSKKQYQLKNEMYGKLIPLWREQIIFYNLLHDTGKTKRKVAEEPGLINLSSYDT